MSSHGHHSSRAHKETARKSLAGAYSSYIKAVENLLASIPPEVISKRAVECKSFSRALFHWEQYIRQCNNQATEQDQTNIEPLYQRLQDIYSQIDEPDGLEGISAHLHVLNVDQQVLEHRKAGRWATAQSWYELQLEKEPENSDAQWNLLTCLKESGQQGKPPTLVMCLLKSDSLSLRCYPYSIRSPQRERFCALQTPSLRRGSFVDHRKMDETPQLPQVALRTKYGVFQHWYRISSQRFSTGRYNGFRGNSQQSTA